MGKVIKYNICNIHTYQVEKPRESEDFPVEYETKTEEYLTPITLSWSEANEELAKREAHKGEYVIVEDDRVLPKAVRIAGLKKKLAATDYKVIKCAECQLMGEEMPYDVAALHAERQAIRDEINALEQNV